MKDIENNASAQTAAALTRLDVALARLERAAALKRTAGNADVATLRQEADALAQRHEALKTSAGQVAVRLDDTIRRLTAVMEREN